MREAGHRGSRWPAAVYDHGEEPDVRFTLANERTFLAWVRTALAFVLAAVVVDAAPLDLADGVRRGGTVGLGLVGCAAAAYAFAGWLTNERALRERRPLPSRVAPGLAVVAALAAAGLFVVAVAVAR